MFIDASAIYAIVARESGYEDLVRRIENVDGQLYTSPISRFEAVISLAHQKAGTGKKPTPKLIKELEETVSAVLFEMAVNDIHICSSIGEGAIRAAAEFGRAVDHPADLNLGDCFSYACAKAFRLKIIYKGNDFAETDLAW